MSESIRSIQLSTWPLLLVLHQNSLGKRRVWVSSLFSPGKTSTSALLDEEGERRLEVITITWLSAFCKLSISTSTVALVFKGRMRMAYLCPCENMTDE
ncbi:hypothetical protein KP509_17G016400 [Ceratopteris richardii]|uniref:Uncharacterized protein n=1 Tax=Ceratopteris richardii TaxID=49495 RepID=A0A8T2SUR0_CERRI|nr:hypothetical protein KP509_17G016400 [Ceratopteris richardii]